MAVLRSFLCLPGEQLSQCLYDFDRWIELFVRYNTYARQMFNLYTFSSGGFSAMEHLFPRNKTGFCTSVYAYRQILQYECGLDNYKQAVGERNICM